MKFVVRLMYVMSVVVLLLVCLSVAERERIDAAASLTGFRRDAELQVTFFHFWFTVVAAFVIHLLTDVREGIITIADRPSAVDELRALKKQKAAR